MFLELLLYCTLIDKGRTKCDTWRNMKYYNSFTMKFDESVSAFWTVLLRLCSRYTCYDMHVCHDVERNDSENEIFNSASSHTLCFAPNSFHQFLLETRTVRTDLQWKIKRDQKHLIIKLGVKMFLNSSYQADSLPWSYKYSTEWNKLYYPWLRQTKPILAVSPKNKIKSFF
jgi:hypothetical protein